MISDFLKRSIFEFKRRFITSNLFSIHLDNEEALQSENLSKLNFNKRKAIVKHAFDHSRFYRKKYASFGYDILNIMTEKDFLKLPVVKRDDIKTNFSEFKADNVSIRDYSKATTGGSTGVPIEVLHDTRYPLAPIQWRVLKWWDIKPYDDTAFIYRIHKKGIKKLLNTIQWWPTKRIFLDASKMNEFYINNFISSFNKIKPTLLQGYTGAVYEFALYLIDHKIKIHAPKAVWVTSSPLTESQRKLMEQVFNAPVYDQYGTCEVMWLSAECKEQKGLHIMSDIRHIEIVDENDMPLPPNVWGKILITDLHNYAFPLIRYEIGDYGRLLDYECGCGIKLPLMDSIKGRKSDVIQTPSGLKISGEYLTTIFDDFPNAVREFQIVQLKDYSVELLFVPLNEKNIDNIISTIISDLNLKINSEIKIRSKKVTKISHYKGKNQFIISQII